MDLFFRLIKIKLQCGFETDLKSYISKVSLEIMLEGILLNQTHEWSLKMCLLHQTLLDWKYRLNWLCGELESLFHFARNQAQRHVGRTPTQARVFTTSFCQTRRRPATRVISSTAHHLSYLLDHEFCRKHAMLFWPTLMGLDEIIITNQLIIISSVRFKHASKILIIGSEWHR